MQLRKAHNENRLEQRLKQFCKYSVLIIDEIGYLPVDRDGANWIVNTFLYNFYKDTFLYSTGVK